MVAATRPFAAAGVALMGAGIVAATPALSGAPALPTLNVPAIELQASILDIFTFPAFQQNVVNQVEFVAIQAAGLAQSGAGVAESVFSLPGTIVTAVQQTFSGDPLGGLATLQTWIVDSTVGIVEPLVVANIEVGQIQLAIQSALLVAQPLALVALGEGLLSGFNAVATAFIETAQNIVAAVTAFNIGDIVNAVVSGIGDVATSFVTGGQAVVTGIVTAQDLLADALAARPVPAQSAALARSAAATPVAERAEATVQAEIATAAEAPEAPAVQAPSTAGVRAAATKPNRAQRTAVTAPAAARSEAAPAESATAAGSAEDTPKPAASRRAAR